MGSRRGGSCRVWGEGGGGSVLQGSHRAGFTQGSCRGGSLWVCAWVRVVLQGSGSGGSHRVQICEVVPRMLDLVAVPLDFIMTLQVPE